MIHNVKFQMADDPLVRIVYDTERKATRLRRRLKLIRLDMIKSNMKNRKVRS